MAENFNEPAIRDFVRQILTGEEVVGQRGRQFNPHWYEHGAMKAALIHFAKGVARSSAAAKVRCNVISPGTVYFEGGVWGNVKANMPGFFDQSVHGAYSAFPGATATETSRATSIAR